MDNERFPYLPVIFDKVHVVAGDLPAGDYKFTGDGLTHDIDQRMTHPNTTATISLVNPGITNISLQTDKTIKNLPIAAAMGVAAGAIFGPLGLIAAFSLGGWGSQVCCLIEFKPDATGASKKFLVVTSEKIYDSLQALTSLKST